MPFIDVKTNVAFSKEKADEILITERFSGMRM